MPPGRAEKQAQQLPTGGQSITAGAFAGQNVSRQAGPRPERPQSCIGCEVEVFSMPAVFEAQTGVQRLR